MPVTIRSRLLLLVLSVLLPGVAAAVWLVAQTYQAERRAVEGNLRDTTRALALVVDGELVQRAAIARVLALSRTLDAAPEILPEQLAGFEQQARRAMQGLNGWVELRSPAGRLMSTQPAAGAAASTAAATGAAAGTGAGITSAAVPPSGAAATSGFRLVDRPLIGPLERASAGGALRAGAWQPVQRDGRTLLNVLVTILPEELQRIVDYQRLPVGWVGTVIDGQGTVVARHPGGVAYAGRTASADMQAQLAAAREATFETVSLDGAPVVGYFSTSAQGWRYVMAVPRPAFAGDLPKAVLQIGLGAALLLALAVVGAGWVSRRIVDPVVSLKRAAARMQAGLPVEARATGIAECDEVATALAEASEAMRHARAELERQVADAVARTREAEQRVSRSQRVEALGRLTGGVAHDFNNLLGVISNSAHLIQRQTGDPALQAPVAATLRAVETGSRLTRQLLRVAGRQPVDAQAVDPARHLPDLHELLKTVLGKRIASSVWVAPNTGSITVDTGELELALINLALNARDALPSGGKVWLKARDAEPYDTAGLRPGRYVLITVGDDGAGVAEDLAERAFEPFFSTKPDGLGSGLGLSQVHGFCVQAGGVARLASTPGLGTTVSMVLPARGGTDEDRAAAPPDRAAPADDIAGKRVLLVEDNDELGDGTAALLASYGCDVRRARSASEALACVVGDAEDAAARPLSNGAAAGFDGFDAVLSDVVMPGGMDGVALARLLRERWPALPVVLISGYSSALAGARDFTVLHKPCTPEELVATLRQAMQRPGALPPR